MPDEKPVLTLSEVPSDADAPTEEAPFDPKYPDRFHPAVAGWLFVCANCTFQNLLRNGGLQFRETPQGIQVQVPSPIPPPFLALKPVLFAQAAVGKPWSFDAARRLVVEGDVTCGDCGCVLVSLAVQQEHPPVPTASVQEMEAMSRLLGPDGRPIRSVY